MSFYLKYLVKDSDKFGAFNYPQLMEDLVQITEETINVPHTFKAEILIAFTKKHSLKNEWIRANPEFVELITTGTLPIKDIEALFLASAKNSFFQQQFESFLTESFAGVAR